MPAVEFVGQSARDSDNIAANPSRLVNLFRQPAVPGGRTRYVLKPVLGSVAFATLDGVFIRALEAVDTRLFAVIGGQAYQIDADGVETALGTVVDGDTTIAGNNGDVTICAGGSYYVWNGTTLTEPTPGAFSSFGSVEYIGNYTVLTEKDGRRFQWSAIADATDLPGLSFSTADGRDDSLVRAFQINGALWLYKQKSHEIWYVTGGAGAEAFERAAGGVTDVGLLGHDLIARFRGGAFFIGDEGRAYIVVGQSVQPISIPPVETAIEEEAPRSCFVYEDEGNTFCVVGFAARPAWVYDIATGEWHERAEGVDLGAWRATDSAVFGGDWYIAADGGTVRRLAKVGNDAGVALIREATSLPLYLDGARFSVHEFEIFMRRGFSDGLVELSMSRDGGVTFGTPKPQTFGPVGDYDTRLNWRQLGLFRQAVAKLRITADTVTPINAEARVRV